MEKSKKLDVQTKLMIRSWIRLLAQLLEMGNVIPDEEALKLLPIVKAQEKNVRYVSENLGRGNVWMAIYFLKEILEQALLSEEY